MFSKIRHDALVNSYALYYILTENVTLPNFHQYVETLLIIAKQTKSKQTGVGHPV